MEIVGFTLFFILFLTYSFLVASWARFFRMNYKSYSPPLFLVHQKIFYFLRWLLLVMLIGYALFIEFPIWIVIFSFLISIWLGRQFTALKLNLEFRDMARNGELKDENGKPFTPKQALKSAMKSEKMWVESYRKGHILW